MIGMGTMSNNIQTNKGKDLINELFCMNLFFNKDVLIYLRIDLIFWVNGCDITESHG